MANLPAERPKYEQSALSAKQQFLSVVDERTWNREVVFALQTMRDNPDAWGKVANENPQSITNCVVNIALCGTTLNPALKQAFMIPRRVKGKMTACLDHSYRGLCNIATSSQGVLDMDADCVYANDYFKYVRGLKPVLEHIPFAMRTDLTDEQRKEGKGVFTYVYATAILPFGDITHTKFIVLDKAEVDKVRRSSQSPDSPMWKDWYDEGARKTAIKKLYKLLPQTDRMSTAIAAINEFDGLETETAAPTNVLTRFSPPAQPSTVLTEEETPYAGEQEISAEELERLKREEIEQFGTEEERKQAGLFNEE